VPTEGCVFLKADYGQVELRVAASIAPDERMIEAFKNDEDLHELTAKQVLNKTEITRDERQLGKTLNFGLTFGMGAEKFASYARQSYGVEMTLDEAKAYRRRFFAAYQGLRNWHRRIGEFGDRPIAVWTRGGRRIQNIVRFNEKLNFGVQGTAADGIKTALALLWERRHECPNACPVLAVHDELVIEVDEKVVDTALEWFRQAVYDGMQPLIDPVPCDVSFSVQKTWAGD
jgi:DNA polymerase-1